MPASVACPACGLDATAQANTEISNALAAAPQAAAPIPVAQPLPVAAPPGAPSSGLRINRTHAEAPATAAPPPPPPGVPFPSAARAASPPPKSGSNATRILSTIGIVILVLIGVLAFGYRWARRISVFTKIAKQVADASSNSGDSSESGGPKNLWYEKCAILIIQHTNHLEVAEACKTFWKDKLHKNLILTQSEGDFMNPGEYELLSAHNGYVRVLGAHEWPIPEHEALAQFLSQKFGGLVFEWRSESFADTYHFGVFDQGVKKFHAQMDIKISNNDADEIVTTTGDDYAIAHGFKPGPEGFKEFSVLEADKITQSLGLKLWDEAEGIQTNATMTLKDTGSLPRTK
jgi:hypothetical protein